MKRREHLKQAFTLVEVLVVLAIIMILAMLVFPAFERAKERGSQANCASNLHQIGIAVQLYFQDERRYPGSLAFLLPASANLYDPVASKSVPNTNGAGYWRGSTDSLLCLNDDTPSSHPRSSYGDISTNIMQGPDKDQGRLMWNYLGYRDDGTAYRDVTECGRVDYWDSRGNSGWYYACSPPDDAPSADKVDTWPRLRSRFAPPSTIVTHCIYHRMPTSNLANPEEAFTDRANAAGAVDLVLRLDNTVKVEATTNSKYAVP